MANVFAAEDLTLGRQVAVKVLHAGGGDTAARLVREGQALARLDHPALVPVYDVGEDDDSAYLVMQLIDGESLKDRLARDAPLATELVDRLARDLLSGLDHAHRAGVVHRDVKPDNILLAEDMRPRLVDFGIAGLGDATALTKTGTTVGTAAYLAPEQVRGDPVGPVADVYSLGLVLLEALTGEKEFDGPMAEAALARLAREPAIPDELDAPWPSLLRRMTALDPDDRATVQEALDLLDGGVGTDDQTMVIEGDPEATTVMPSTGPPSALVEVHPPTTEAMGSSEPTATLAGPPTSTEDTASAVHDTPSRPTRALGALRDAASSRLALVGLAVLVLVAVIIGVAAVAGDDPLPSPPVVTTVSGESIPDDLVEALDRLDRAVQP